MTVTINGTTGIAGVDGSAGTPAVQGGDTNTGVFFPAADTVAIATGGTEAVRVDSSRNVGIGTSSPQTILHANSSGTNALLKLSGSSSGSGLNDGFDVGINTLEAIVWNREAGSIQFGTSNAERARIDSSGNLLVGTTSLDGNIGGNSGDNTFTFRKVDGLRVAQTGASYWNRYTSGSVITWRCAGTDVGSVSVNGSNTAYNTSSDYRLKEDIQPMTGALAKVQALKPCTYKWKADGTDGQGFIAHELQAVVPDCVIGEKDAVNEDGSIKPQGIDTSFLVATLTAAIQELNAKVEALEAQLAGAAS